MRAKSEIADFVRDRRARVEAALERWLPSTSLQPQQLHAAMRHATLDGGKRVRPLLTYATGHALGVTAEQLDGPACAVELIHAYSLVHDDLPAMDDDELRRGRPTVHRAYDEATAILTGDALQSLAFHVLAHDPRMRLEPGPRLGMVETLALASGSRGMAGGQALDLAAVGRDLDLAQLENLHIHKTGALIRASVALGSKHALHPGLDHYAKCIGLAFQIQDDILDVEGETARIGKTRGKDHAQGKPTYPSLLGLEGARDKARELHEEALESLSEFAAQADPLRWLADYIIGRAH